MRRGRRSKYDIYADILDAVRRNSPCTLTRASYGARMPLDRAKEAVRKLERAGFLESITIGGRKHYIITPKGAEFLELYRRLKALLAAIEHSP
ncbi:MAG TPA: hypothetical protein ENF34_05130 [Candidatus Bathyarchaeota archaeon]|nr:hypothetical protein [Candidatus Bathyarchaeota archaeon]